MVRGARGTVLRRSASVRALAATAALVWLSSGAPAQAMEDNDDVDVESVVVTAARSGQLVRDQPIRVEVVPDVEIEESLSVAPGNLTNLLNELAGARLQASAPGLGGAELQLRGLPGRHAQVLSDGLPLAGAQTDSFGLLQTPPLDLERVELIKGVASALYGGSALAGVMNLVSHGPGNESQALFSQTSEGGTDAVGFFASEAGRPFGYTFTGGAHYQARKDPDHDGWAEQPGYERATLRPRLYWSDGDDRSVFATLGVMREDRTGGTMDGRTLADGSEFPEALHTRRIDAGAVANFKLADSRVLNVRCSTSVTDHDRVFGNMRVDDTEANVFGEATLHGEIGAHKWVAGAALQYERLHTHDIAGVSYDYSVPAVFVQDEVAPVKWLALAGSARVDAHSDYGTFVSPRVSALFRPPAGRWSLRASVGSGFAAPTPLVEDVQARSLGVLSPLRALRAERASSASLDAKWARKPWDINVSAFASQIRHALAVRESASDRLDLVNSDGPFRVRGAETLIGYTEGPFHVLANATLLDVTEVPPGEARREADLVPKFSAELAIIVEDEDRGRIGMEIAYTGRQHLSDNPFREVSEPYVEVNVLGELKVGKAAVFLNVMNLTNVRQRDDDPLLRPSPGPAGDPITDVWAPLLGRTFNVGVRVEL
jgi:iron complex outermembrane receptor protein